MLLVSISYFTEIFFFQYFVAYAVSSYKVPLYHNDTFFLLFLLSISESDAKPGDIIKTYPVKPPMKGDRFLVKVVDSCNVPHKLFLKNTDKIEKRKLNMLLAKKSLEPLTCMPMSQLEERTYVLVKFRKPAKLLRAQVNDFEYC